MNTYNMDKMYNSYSSDMERMQNTIKDLQQENQKYKEVIDKAIEELMNIPINASYSEIVEYPRKAYRILKEVE